MKIPGIFLGDEATGPANLHSELKELLTFSKRRVKRKMQFFSHSGSLTPLQGAWGPEGKTLGLELEAESL